MASAAVLVGAAQASADEGPPTIDGISVSNVSENGTTIEAQINSHGGKTLYEIRLVWQDAQPPSWGESLTGGIQSTSLVPIAAGFEDVSVSLALNGLRPGYSYWYLVRAGNRAGEVNADGKTLRWFAFANSAAYPEGWMPEKNGLYEPLAPFWITFSAEDAAARRVREFQEERERRAREQQAREQQERAEAARFAEAQAAVKQHDEELEALARKASAVRCVVPALRGNTLSTARRALSRHHCRLGKVRWPRHHHGALVVVAQTPRHGRRLARGTPIAVTLGSRRRQQKARTAQRDNLVRELGTATA